MMQEIIELYRISFCTSCTASRLRFKLRIGYSFFPMENAFRKSLPDPETTSIGTTKSKSRSIAGKSKKFVNISSPFVPIFMKILNQKKIVNTNTDNNNTFPTEFFFFINRYLLFFMITIQYHNFSYILVTIVIFDMSIIRPNEVEYYTTFQDSGSIFFYSPRFFSFQSAR